MCPHEVATISWLPTNIGLFCKKEPYKKDNKKEPYKKDNILQKRPIF